MMTDTPILTVSELNRIARMQVEECFENVWIEGEISNFSAPSSGHWYFSLKDESAQIRAALFRARQRNIGFTPENGMHVLVKAKATIYEQRGDFQLIVEEMEERGAGKLQRLFEQLKKKLAAAGWFDPKHKKPLPEYPNTIGIVSSPTGAAVHDILTVLKRRYPLAEVILYPCLVQGKEAVHSIANAIKIANERKECEVLIVGRGGGSLEDLWAFNEEITARAMFESELPIVSAVGHEIDFTIADFVADVRAPTPSAAAELLTPDGAHLQHLLTQQRALFIRKIQHVFQYHEQRLLLLEKHHLSLHPQHQLNQMKYILMNQLQQLRSTIAKKLEALQSELRMYSEKIDVLSPLKTLSRGYCIVFDNRGHIISKKDQATIGETIQVNVQDGTFSCEIISY